MTNVRKAIACGAPVTQRVMCGMFCARRWRLLHLKLEKFDGTKVARKRSTVCVKKITCMIFLVVLISIVHNCGPGIINLFTGLRLKLKPYGCVSCLEPVLMWSSLS